MIHQGLSSLTFMQEGAIKNDWKFCHNYNIQHMEEETFFVQQISILTVIDPKKSGEVKSEKNFHSTSVPKRKVSHATAKNEKLFKGLRPNWRLFNVKFSIIYWILLPCDAYATPFTKTNREQKQWTYKGFIFTIRDQIFIKFSHVLLYLHTFFLSMLSVSNNKTRKFID